MGQEDTCKLSSYDVHIPLPDGTARILRLYKINAHKKYQEGLDFVTSEQLSKPNHRIAE